MCELIINREANFVVNPPFPHNMLMELTNTCNHQCVFCGYQKMHRKKRVLKEELAKKLLNEAYQLGTREVGFYLIGEPLLYPKLAEIIEYAKSIGYEYIYLTTNGVLASKEKMKELIKSGLNSIKFSVNGASPQGYQKIHGKDDFFTVKKNIEDLYDLKQKEKIEIKSFISFIKNEWNKEEEDLLFEQFETLVDKIYVFQCINQGGEMNELLEKGIVNEANAGSSLPCEMIFNRIHITSEGYLNACCADVEGYLSAADLQQISLKEAWESQTMKDLRKHHLENNLKGTACYNCIYNKNEKIFPINKELCSLSIK